MNILFKEQQQFRQKSMYFLYAFLLAFLCLFVYACIQQIILHKPFGDKPAPDILLILCTVLLAVLPVCLYIVKLETVITIESVSYRWYPFKTKYTTIDWQDVQQADIFKYDFVGLGYRFTPHGTLHNVSGDTGLRLKMRWGKTLIIGTRKAEELQSVLDSIHKQP